MTPECFEIVTESVKIVCFGQLGPKTAFKTHFRGQKGQKDQFTHPLFEAILGCFGVPIKVHFLIGCLNGILESLGSPWELCGLPFGRFSGSILDTGGVLEDRYESRA